MAKKIFKYQGKTVDELKALSMDELLPLLNSAARRKITRGFPEAEQIFLDKIKVKINVKTHCRDALILPYMVSKTVKVFRGNSFDDILIQPEMIGHRLGEFALSRKRTSHGSMGVGASKGGANASRK